MNFSVHLSPSNMCSETNSFCWTHPTKRDSMKIGKETVHPESDLMINGSKSVILETVGMTCVADGILAVCWNHWSCDFRHLLAGLLWLTFIMFGTYIVMGLLVTWQGNIGDHDFAAVELLSFNSMQFWFYLLVDLTSRAHQGTAKWDSWQICLAHFEGGYFGGDREDSRHLWTQTAWHWLCPECPVGIDHWDMYLICTEKVWATSAFLFRNHAMFRSLVCFVWL